VPIAKNRDSNAPTTGREARNVGLVFGEPAKLGDRSRLAPSHGEQFVGQEIARSVFDVVELLDPGQRLMNERMARRVTGLVEFPAAVRITGDVAQAAVRVADQARVDRVAVGLQIALVIRQNGSGPSRLREGLKS
jgi:hypothetical protein